MSDYVLVKNIEDVSLYYDGDNYIRMRIGNSLKSTDVLKHIFISCTITKINGETQVIDEVRADLFNQTYGDIVRYKKGTVIHSFEDEEVENELHTATINGYLFITPIVAVYLAKPDINNDIVLTTLQVFEREPLELDKPLSTNDIDSTIIGESGGFPNVPNGNFIYSQYPNINDAELFAIQLTKGIPNNSYYVVNAISTPNYDDQDFYHGYFNYDGFRYEIVNRILTLKKTLNTFNSTNGVYFRIDGLESISIEFNRSNYLIKGSQFVDDDITVIAKYTDGINEYPQITDREYVVGSGFVSHGDTLSLNGIYNIQIRMPIYKGTDDSYIYSEIVQLKVYSNIVDHISISNIKSSYVAGESFYSSSISVKAYYLIQENEYYEDFLSKQNYTLNIEDGTKIFEETTLTATLISNNSITSSLSLLVVLSATNKLLVYDKTTKEESDFGDIDISSGFNLCFSIDNTRDSAKIRIINDKNYVLEKNTICKLTFNYTWWVVKSDKKSVIYGENNKYSHDIELVAPKTLLYSRDLVSCGFNKNRYTYSQFFERMVNLSKCENYRINLSDVFGNNNKVSIIKSFDNYTLGKALEEFSNGENSIYEVDYIDIDNPFIYFISKSGTNKDIIDLDTSEIHGNKLVNGEEIGNKDFATKVISNVQNAVSSVYQRYPINGGKYLDSDSYLLDKDNAYFRLPSKAKEVISLIIVPKIQISFVKYVFSTEWNPVYISTNFFYPNSIDQIVNELNKITIPSEYLYGKLKTKEQIAKAVLDNALIKLYIDKQENKLTSNADSNLHPMFISKNLISKYETSQWNFQFQNGDNKITNFNALLSTLLPNQGTKISKIINDLFSLNFSIGNNDIAGYPVNPNEIGVENLRAIVISANDKTISTLSTKFACEYIPQADFRMEYDNNKIGKDITLFNQTGNFVDNYAVSKLVKSYSKDISNNTFNIYNSYDNYFDIMQKGQRVYFTINGKKELCIVNNVSIDYRNGNKYKVMYTLSENVATKSLMINADSNIRDYDCPQRNSVVRKQNYRDFIELELNQDNRHLETMYGKIEDIFNFNYKNKGSNFQYQAFLNIDDRFYQIPTYVINYDSSCSCIVDFRDNNIIGYDKSNTGSSIEWEISSWTSFLTSTVRYNTPIDYTIGSGIYGEVKSIEIKLANQEQIDSAFETYKNTYGLGSLDNQYSIVDIEPLCFKNYYNIVSQSCKITENNYNKDGLEIPFFQYTAQIGDTDNVLIGSKILEKREIDTNNIFIYQFHIKDKIKSNNYNFDNVVLSNSNNSTTITLNNACVLSLDKVNMKIVATFYSYATINVSTGVLSNTRNFKLDGTIKNKNIEIVLGESGVYDESINQTKELDNCELVLSINNCPIELNNNSQLEFFINNYKL